MVSEAPFDAVDILGVRVAVSSVPEVAGYVVGVAAQGVRGGRCSYVCATSVHGLIEGDSDRAFRDILNGADIVAPDGVPLVWFSRLRGFAAAQRVYGPDLMLAVCRASAPQGLRHYFYGGAPGVPKQLGSALAGRFPGLRVAGAHSPPFRDLSESELREVAHRINASTPDILWVGLSTPKQERWIAAVRHLLQVPIAVTVGAAFDFHTGRLRQAPAWVQRAGLEWAFRLAVEPRRLWRRYSRNNPRFVALAARQLLSTNRTHAVSS